MDEFIFLIALIIIFTIGIVGFLFVNKFVAKKQEDEIIEANSPKREIKNVTRWTLFTLIIFILCVTLPALATYGMLSIYTYPFVFLIITYVHYKSSYNVSKILPIKHIYSILIVFVINIFTSYLMVVLVFNKYELYGPITIITYLLGLIIGNIFGVIKIALGK